MWDVLTTNNPLIKDHQAFYGWLKDISADVLKGEKPIMDKQDMLSFCTDKLNSEDTNFKHLSMDGYYWIQTFFVLVNKEARRLLVLDDEERAPPAAEAGQSAASGTAEKPGAPDGKKVSFTDDAKTGTKEKFTAFGSDTGPLQQDFSFTKKDA